MTTQTDKTNRQTKFLLTGLKNLRGALTGFSLENFVVTTLEMLMYIERDEYLENLKKLGAKQDKGNGIYTRSFKSLSKNSLLISIPRTRYTDFKPLVLELLKYN